MRQLFRKVVGGGSVGDVRARVVILIFIIVHFAFKNSREENSPTIL